MKVEERGSKKFMRILILIFLFSLQNVLFTLELKKADEYALRLVEDQKIFSLQTDVFNVDVIVLLHSW